MSNISSLICEFPVWCQFVFHSPVCPVSSLVIVDSSLHLVNLLLTISTLFWIECTVSVFHGCAVPVVLPLLSGLFPDCFSSLHFLGEYWHQQFLSALSFPRTNIDNTFSPAFVSPELINSSYCSSWWCLTHTHKERGITVNTTSPDFNHLTVTNEQQRILATLFQSCCDFV